VGTPPPERGTLLANIVSIGTSEATSFFNATNSKILAVYTLEGPGLLINRE
jgi:hypothetical protein